MIALDCEVHKKLHVYSSVKVFISEAYYFILTDRATFVHGVFKGIASSFTKWKLYTRIHIRNNSNGSVTKQSGGCAN